MIGMTMAWPQLASPVKGFVFSQSRRRLTQKVATKRTDRIPILIQVIVGKPKNKSGSFCSRSAPPGVLARKSRVLSLRGTSVPTGQRLHADDKKVSTEEEWPAAGK